MWLKYGVISKYLLFIFILHSVPTFLCVDLVSFLDFTPEWMNKWINSKPAIIKLPDLETQGFHNKKMKKWQSALTF